MIDLDVTLLREQFHDLQTKLEEWGKTVDKILNDYVKSLGYSSERIQQMAKSRVKDEESFIQKALYRGKKYTNPIIDITDKVGTRIVLLNISDVNLISDFIKKSNEWKLVEQAQDIDYIREHDPTEFKYQSNHFVVRPIPPKYSKEDCDFLTCEIQVRTLLQHAYAETSHDTVYKKGHSDDPKVIRSLAVTMAFLETADEKIRYIYESTQKEQSAKSSLIEMMKGKYLHYVPTFNPEKYDAGITEAFLSIFPEDFFVQATDSFMNFVANNNDDIQAALDKQPLSILFQQPISLMAFYAIRKRQTCTIQNWPFTKESLKEVLLAMNISEDALS